MHDYKVSQRALEGYCVSLKISWRFRDGDEGVAGRNRREKHFPDKGSIICLPILFKSMILNKKGGNELLSRPVRDDALDLLQFVILVPHLTPVPDNVGHWCIDNHVTGHVQVSDPIVWVDHGKACKRNGKKLGNKHKLSHPWFSLISQLQAILVQKVYPIWGLSSVCTWASFVLLHNVCFDLFLLGVTLDLVINIT